MAKKVTLKSTRVSKKTASSLTSPRQLIDGRIRELAGWRGEILGRIRTIIKLADPAIAEEWNRDAPAWSCGGIICTGETYKSVVKMTFPKGAFLSDPSRLFNAGLEDNARRAIDFHEGDRINENALRLLIRAAVALNRSEG